MTNIKIGEHLIEGAALTVSPNLLGMNFETDKTLCELAEMFDAEAAPEIHVLDASGKTVALYKNHKLTTLQVETIGGRRRVSASLQVTPLEMGGESVDIAAMQEEINELRAALNAIEEGIADA